MKKVFKFAVGLASLAAIVGGAYYFLKKYVIDYIKDDDFEDFDEFDDPEDFDDYDEFDDNLEDVVDVSLSSMEEDTAAVSGTE